MPSKTHGKALNFEDLKNRALAFNKRVQDVTDKHGPDSPEFEALLTETAKAGSFAAPSRKDFLQDFSAAAALTKCELAEISTLLVESTMNRKVAYLLIKELLKNPELVLPALGLMYTLGFQRAAGKTDTDLYQTDTAPEFVKSVEEAQEIDHQAKDKYRGVVETFKLLVDTAVQSMVIQARKMGSSSSPLANGKSIVH